VLPLLAADAPVVTWWHAAPPKRLATDALAVIADRRITDSSNADDPMAALRTRAEDYAPGDTDLSWTRATPWRATLTSTLDSVAGRRGDPVLVRGGSIEGNADSATARLLAGWISSRCGCPVDVVASTRTTGPSGVDSVTLVLDQDEEVRVQVDRRGGAIISQPYRPDSLVALPDLSLGDLLGEELRRLDPDEPYSDALEATTGVSGLAERSPVREHVWFDPADPDGSAARKADGRAARSAAGHTARDRAPTVPADSEGAEEAVGQGRHGETVTAPRSTRGGAGRSRSATGKRS
jgi:glucose-6-phosphate dehydrogenase assembly protein OpcA